jgi:hypothetical protein
MDMPSGKKAKEQEERIKNIPKLTFFSKTTYDTTSTSTSKYFYRIAEQKEELSIYA